MRSVNVRFFTEYLQKNTSKSSNIVWNAGAELCSALYTFVWRHNLLYVKCDEL